MTAPPRCPNCASLEAQNTELDRKLAELEQVDLSRCPQCNGPADNGHDRSIPPNPYLCTKCMAEPVQEPVAWIQPDHLQKARVAPFLCRVEPTQRCPDFVAIYTAPPQRQPLSGLEVERLLEQVIGSLPAARNLVRAVERAHGIVTCGDTKERA